MYELFPCSPLAVQKLPAGFDLSKADLSPLDVAIKSNAVYPFKRMRVGHSFGVPASQVKEINLRVAVSKANKSTKANFVIVKHVGASGEASTVFEVVRIA